MATYKEQQNQKYIDRTLQMLCDLPDFCSVFYDKKQQKLSPKTLCDYSRHMKDYLEYLQQYDPRFSDRELIDFTIEDLSQISVSDAIDFIKWITRSVVDNRASCTSNKMSLSSAKTWKACISAYFVFFTFSGQLNGNPFNYVDLAKIVTCDDVREKEKEGKIANKKVMTVAAADADGTSGLINRSFIHSDKESDDRGNDWAVGEQPELSEKESIQFRQQFMLKHGIRDTLICSILQDAGIRISELVELNEKDVDLSNKRFYAYRAKNKSSWVSISDDVYCLLQVYTEQRTNWIGSVMCEYSNDYGGYENVDVVTVDRNSTDSYIVQRGSSDVNLSENSVAYQAKDYQMDNANQDVPVSVNSNSHNHVFGNGNIYNSSNAHGSSNTYSNSMNNNTSDNMDYPSEPSVEGWDGSSVGNETVQDAGRLDLLERQLFTKQSLDVEVRLQENKHQGNIENVDLDALFIVMAGRCRGQRLSVRTVQRAMKEWKREIREYLEQKRM